MFKEHPTTDLMIHLDISSRSLLYYSNGGKKLNCLVFPRDMEISFLYFCPTVYINQVCFCFPKLLKVF